MRKYILSLLFAALLPGFILPGVCFGQGRDRRRPVPDQTSSLGLTVTEAPAGGVLVNSVTAGGLSQAAGIMPGDMIVSIGGQAVSKMEDLRKGQMVAVNMIQMGSTVEIAVVRDGAQLTLNLGAGAAVAADDGAARRQRFRTQTAEPAGPWLGMSVTQGVQGVQVSAVYHDSPAAQAGILSRDLVSGVNGTPVKSVSEFDDAVSKLSAGQPCRIAIQRRGLSANFHMTPAVKPAAGGMGLVKSGASDINVLKYAVIDPQTRSVLLLGGYDAAYNTGPIPYDDLLKDALASPYPWFSLEPTDQTRSGVQRINEAIGADVQRMDSDPQYSTVWTSRLQNLLLNDPDMDRDRKRFTSKGAEAFGISEDEMLKVLRKSAGDASVSTDEIMPILGKILMGLGYNQLGEALLYQDEGTDMTFMRLGISEQAAPIISQFRAGQISENQATIELSVIMESAILRALRIPDHEIDSRANRVLSGSMSLAEFSQFMEESLMAIIVDGVGLKMFNGLTLSHELLCKLYNVPVPQMNLVFRDVSPDSALGDTMFHADYALKSICTDPDVKNKIPGFPTEMEYMYGESLKRGVRIPGDAGAQVGHKLIPGEVKMSVSPSGNLVSFDHAQVKIMGWVIQIEGANATPQVAEAIEYYTKAYADYITSRYEDLARVYPELHRLREAAKVMALVRWANAGNLSLVADRASGMKIAQVQTATGFWQGVFTANQQEFSLTIIAQGGASFDREEGEAWVQPAQNVEFTDNVLKQLAASENFARLAAGSALDGDMETARDLADKSARAMTGEIDRTTLPLLDVPVPSEPVLAASLAADSLAVIDQNIEAIDNAKILAENAGALETSSPQDAAQLQAMAELQRQQAQQHLTDLKNALDSVRQNPGNIGATAVAIRDLKSWPAVPVQIPGGSPAVTTGTPTAAAPEPPDALNQPGKQKTRQELMAELDRLQKEMDAAKAQLAKLSYSIRMNQQQFSEWEEVSEKGMEKCRDILFGLVMDAGAGKLLDRYDTMYDLAKKLPDQPAPLIKRLGRTKELLTGLSDAKSFKDVVDWAYANGDTLPDVLEKLRDGIGLITTLKGWDKTLVGAAWNYGSNMVDMAYAFAQYSASYDAITQQTQNVEEFNKALASMKTYMDQVLTQTRDVKRQLAEMDKNENF